MRKMLCLVAVAMSLQLCQSAPAALISYFNFNSFAVTDTTISADQGSGTIDLTGFGGGIANFQGSTINALDGDPAGASLSLQGGVAGSGTTEGNGTFIEIQASLSGFLDPVITFATRGTSSGFDSSTWSWSTDGTTFTELPGVSTATRTTSFDLATVDFTGVGGLNDASSAFFRYTVDGASTTGGNNRIDNLQINATAIPEPGSFAILGIVTVGGSVIARRRRQAVAS